MGKENDTDQPAEIVREYGPFPGAPHVHGVSFDGSLVWFASGEKLQAFEPASGRIVRAHDVACDAGTAFDGRHLFQIAGDRIHKIDPDSGAILRSIESNRFVTGVTWVDGELWHGTWEGDDADIRQVDPETGEVLTRLTMPEGTAVSGLESDQRDLFYAGGGESGRVRAVRKPRRRSGR